MRKIVLSVTVAIFALSGCESHASHEGQHKSEAHEAHHIVSDAVIAEQRKLLAQSIVGKNPGAQAPRDIDSLSGRNTKATTHVYDHSQMYLCDIHFHKSAEHKGGEFTEYAGNGNGEGYGSGYKYSGTLTKEELSFYEIENEHNPLYAGDTIETHYVYSSNPMATLGHGLGTCLAGLPANAPQPALHVEAQVYVLVNDKNALDFTKLNEVTKNAAGHYQANNTPNNTGTPVEYDGSTTGPGYNEKFSPYQVSWSVRPKVAKVNIETVKEWFDNNQFEENHAHGVRNLVKNPALLSKIN